MLAAFVDGEGTITIDKTKKRAGRYAYTQRLQIANTDVRLIDWLVENFGGSYPKPYKDKNETHKDHYNWKIFSVNSYKLIKIMRPYLILKGEQADNAMELWERINKFHYVSTNPMPYYKKKIAEEIYQRNKVLNMRGKNVNDGSDVSKLVHKLVRRKTITLEDFE